jgi:hypothetical protein
MNGGKRFNSLRSAQNDEKTKYGFGRCAYTKTFEFQMEYGE